MVDGDSVYARIVCQNVIGMSIPSDVENGAIIPSIPHSVTQFTCTDRTINSISLSWAEPSYDGGSPLTCYEITHQKVGHVNNNFGVHEVFTNEICSGWTTQRDSAGNFVNNQNWFENRAYTVTGLDNNSQYTFTIVAKNIAGSSIPVQATCIACVTPSVPVNLREVYSQRSLNTLGMQWDQGFNNGAADIQYTVYVEWEENGVVENYSTINDANGLLERSFYAEDLLVGTEYTVSVSASNICGASPRSAELLLTAGIAPTCANNYNSRPVYTQRESDDRVSCNWDNAIPNGFPVFGYRVMIQSSDSTYYTVTQDCEEYQGSTLNTVFNYNYLIGNSCTLNEAKLRTSPFNLGETAEISCHIIASN